MRFAYLDSVIIIYAVEAVPGFGPRALTHIAKMRAASDSFAVTDLTWLECQVKPLKRNDMLLLAAFQQFLTAPDIVPLPLPRSVYLRAASIRAQYNYKTVDAIHLAAAVEGQCDVFVTHDLRLRGFPDITVEVLP